MEAPAEIQARVERRLRALLVDGISLEDAIRSVHRDDGIGKLWLWQPVSAVASLTEADAKRLVIHALAPWRQGEPDQ